MIKALTVAAMLAMAGTGHAADLAVPHEFAPGTTIKSSEVNENFSILYQKINELQNEVKRLSGYHPVTEATAEGNMIAHYQFDNGFENSLTSSDDASSWENSDTLIVQEGSLILQNNQDNDPKSKTGISIDTTGIDKVTIEKRTKIIAKGEYSLSTSRISDGTNTLDVKYNYYHYSGTNEAGQYDNREHFYIINNLNSSNLIDTRFDQWVKEVIVADFANNQMHYSISGDDGENVETLLLEGIAFNRSSESSIRFYASDWANGTQHVIEDLKIYTVGQ